MLRYLIIGASLGLAAQSAFAEQAGKIIFVAGAAHIAERPAALGMAVQEGELLSTGADGYLYVKTVDNGLFILRPQTQARIAAYHVDTQNSANTRVKLELLGGVARSKSGEAVKQARQNFRFNTPVAAIGVRGTDFTVFADQDTTRVAVIAGGVTVSALAGACRAEGFGPCEGSPSRELSAAQKGQLLQIQRGQAAPNLMPGTVLSPEMGPPPRSDEPLGKNGGGGALTPAGADPSLEAQRVASLKPSVIAPATPAMPAPEPVPERVVSWGRWQAVPGAGPTSTLGKPGAERIALNDYYVLFRDRAGALATLPQQGSAGFALNNGEAYVRNSAGGVATAAGMENGQLLVDFNKSTFSTKFDLLVKAERFQMQAQGQLGADGRLYGDNWYTPGTNMTVNGALGANNDATYLFQRRLDDKRTASGVAYWTK